MNENKKQFILNLGNRIKSRRIELGMSQEELAFKCGYKSRSSVNKIELGFSDIPQSKINSIANALETTAGYLMGWVDNPSQYSIFETSDDLFENAPEHVKELAKETAEQEEAKTLYNRYKNAPPHIKAAIEALLKTESD